MTKVRSTFGLNLKILVPVLCLINIVTGDHFRGGTINWKPTGNGNEVEFNVTTGWRYSSYCSSANGQFVNQTGFTLICTSGCQRSTVVNPMPFGFTCVENSQVQTWGRAEHTFTHTFPDEGPFTVGYSDCCWIGELGTGNWNIETTIDLRTRSDTGLVNQSPVARSNPMYYIQFGCTEDIVIPVTDADGDNIRCRWSTGNECSSVCGPVANIALNENTCTLTVNANNAANGLYAIALTIEDRPRTNIMVGNDAYTTTDVLSSIPLQFVLSTPSISRPCNYRPVFVSPTPSPTELLVVAAGDTITIPVHATSAGTSISDIRIIDPPGGMTQTAVAPDNGQANVYFTTLSWRPAEADQGNVTVCVEATDRYVISSQTCFSIKAWDVSPCASEPCFFGGTCTRRGFTDEYDCACQPGYTSRQCHIDIDECASNPCQHDGTCVDEVNGYQCVCVPGYTGSDCKIDINECASNPCLNGATCFDLIDEWFCGCVEGYTGISCETDIDECYHQPCENGGTCRDMVGSSVCDCITGTYGSICQNGLEHCLSLPCENHGRCINTNDSTGYMCDCVDGWQGKNCAYRFENSSFGNNTGMVSEYMHYSDCNCKLGNDRNDLCYMYTIGKDTGFGLLGVFLGILSSILLYVAYLCLFRRVEEASGETVDTDDSENTIFGGMFDNKVHHKDEPVVVPDNTQAPVETVEKKDEKPTRREHKCWACDVKKNITPAPNYYQREHRHYSNMNPLKSAKSVKSLPK